MTIGAQYQAAGLKPPPPSLVSVTASFKQDADSQTHRLSFNQDIKIPDGYTAYGASVNYGSMTYEDPGQSVFGAIYISIYGESGASATTTQNAVYQFTFSQSIENSVSLKFAFHHVYTFAGMARVDCILTDAAYEAWQNSTYDAIAQAHQNLESVYERAVAEASTSSTTVVQGNNPDENTKLIRNELTKACITILTGQTFDIFDGTQLDTTNNIVETDYKKALVQGPLHPLLPAGLRVGGAAVRAVPVLLGAQVDVERAPTDALVRPQFR
jgi:hypothetical protein